MHPHIIEAIAAGRVAEFREDAARARDVRTARARIRRLSAGNPGKAAERSPRPASGTLLTPRVS